MYLLMLLATFVSAIYGYNMSARPDYDRDVARKKAAAVVYKFVFHHKAVQELVQRVEGYLYSDCGVTWVMPGDLLYADASSDKAEDNEDTTLFLKQDGKDAVYFHLRERNKKGETQNSGFCGTPFDHLLVGHFLFDGSEMATQLFCLDQDLWQAEHAKCNMDPYKQDLGDGNYGYTGSCCASTKFRYMVSYKKLDARWVNRVTQGVNLDFISVLSKRSYNDNIGIIHWDGENWQFQGRIKLRAVYAEDELQWAVDHQDDPPETRYYPAEYKERTVWTLPNKVFGENVFKGKDGSNICQHGCLFKIQNF